MWGAPGATPYPTQLIEPIGYPAHVDGDASGMTDALLSEHIDAQLTRAVEQARAANRTLVAITCVGPLGMHVNEDPRTAQVVARAVCRVDADIALILAEAHDCARVVMDCGMRVAMAVPRPEVRLVTDDNHATSKADFDPNPKKNPLCAGLLRTTCVPQGTFV